MSNKGDWNPIAKEYNPLKAGSIDGTDVEPHDRAVFRAMFARYKPNKGVTGDPLLTVFVARLNPLTTEEKLHDVFSKFGDILRLRLVRDIVTGFSKCYAFVEYKEELSVFKAWRGGNKLVVDQHEVFVDMEQERTLNGWVPRRLGGGLGGKKESGQLRFGGRDRPFRKPINLGGGGPAHGGGEGGWRDRDRSGPRERFDRDRRRDFDRGSRDNREDRDFDRGSRDNREDRDFDRRSRDNREDRDFDRGSRDNREDRDFDRGSSRDNREDRDRSFDRGSREPREDRDRDKHRDRSRYRDR